MLKKVQLKSVAAPQRTNLRGNRNFMLLWSGQAASVLGTQVSALPFQLIAVTVLKATTFEVALLVASASIPYLLISLPAGVLVEHAVDKHQIMVRCDLGRMCLMASIPIAGFFWHVTLWQMYLVTITSGVLSVVFDIAYQSLLPAIVSKQQLISANGRLAVTESFARLAGPSVGGALVGLIGVTSTVIADSASYAMSALSLQLIKVPERQVAPRTAQTSTTFRQSMWEGLLFVATQPILRRIVAATATWNLFWSGADAIRVVFLSKVLHARPLAIGVVFAMGACGGLIGGVIAGKVSEKVGSARVMWLSLLAPGPACLLLPLAKPGWGVILYGIGLFTYSVGGIVYNTAQISFRQAVCPPSLLSRMNASVRWLVWGTLPLGALAGGLIGSSIGLRPTLWVCACGTWAGSLWLVLSPLRRYRSIEDYVTIRVP